MNLKSLYLCTFLLLTAAAPAAAESWLHVDSDPGDYIGQGKRQTWTDRDGVFTASPDWANGANISFIAPGYTVWWYLHFTAPFGERLQPGVYLNATRWPFQDDDNPGLDVSGDGRGCNQSSGWFQVLEVSYGPGGEVRSFAADFEQHCEFGEPALRGGVRVNSSIPFTPTPRAFSPLAQSTMEFASEQGDWIGGGRSWTLSRADGTFTSRWSAPRMVQIAFRSRDWPGSGSYFSANFAAPVGQVLKPGRYLNATRYPFQAAGVPGLDVSGDSRGCNTLKGSFEILEITFSGSELKSFEATFIQYCGGGTAALRGTIRYNSRFPHAQPFDVDVDTMPDILFHRASDGALQAWNMLDTSRRFAFGTALPSLPSNEWRVVGTGDLNADGTQDVVAQHRTTKQLIVWHLQGTKLLDGAYLSPDRVPDGWDVVGVTDLDGDKHADLLLRHHEGWVAVWLMNGRTLRDGRILPDGFVPDRGWRIAGTGDVNADGSQDLIWQHDEGWIAAWLMHGTARLDVVWMSPNRMPDGWSIGGVTDLNQDGSPDLLIQHVDGRVAAWLMRGTTLLDGRMLSPETPGAGWRLAGPR